MLAQARPHDDKINHLTSSIIVVAYSKRHGTYRHLYARVKCTVAFPCIYRLGSATSNLFMLQLSCLKVSNFVGKATLDKIVAAIVSDISIQQQPKNYSSLESRMSQVRNFSK